MVKKTGEVDLEDMMEEQEQEECESEPTAMNLVDPQGKG